MSFKIVFFDIDGTLVDENNTIPFDTFQAIQQLKERNIKVVIATGRPPYRFKEIREQLGINSFVSMNGAYAVCDGLPIFHNVIPKTTLEQLNRFSNKSKHPLVFVDSQGGYVTLKSYLMEIEFYQMNNRMNQMDVRAYRYHPAPWNENNIYQGLLFCQSAESHEYSSRFEELSFVRWHKFCVDVIPTGGSKAIGIENLLKHLEISPSEAVAFGDGLNDEEMLSFVGMGVAMGNASDEVKQFAHHTTKDVNNGGISHTLHRLNLI